jgi:hypothetical protein
MVLLVRHSRHRNGRPTQQYRPLKHRSPYSMHTYTLTSRTLSYNAHVLHIPAEARNVLFEPLECEILVVQAIVLWYEVSGVISMPESQGTETVVYSNKDHGLVLGDGVVHQGDGAVVRTVSGTKELRATMDEY